jgi:hypothetical protein
VVVSGRINVGCVTCIGDRISVLSSSGSPQLPEVGHTSIYLVHCVSRDKWKYRQGMMP